MKDSVYVITKYTRGNVPVLGGFFGQVSGLFVRSTRPISVVAFVMFALDVLMIYLASQVFDRESMFTPWR